MGSTLIDELFDEMDRCRELVAIYRNLGTVGAFGAATIGKVIKDAEDAIKSGDVVREMGALSALKGCQ